MSATGLASFPTAAASGDTAAAAVAGTLLEQGCGAEVTKAVDLPPILASLATLDKTLRAGREPWQTPSTSGIAIPPARRWAFREEGLAPDGLLGGIL
eukprot:CAMPEP_0168432382 /NCGR_PEP_ID=MMETSP0228-20121227/38862_1 /TAXON_ID=133427 /ORGANISM="Protoceratium reticulatum, Strain CCCM 535 (=CCMP 1889)" /LENGTH=96 /DNA_ID=CAMNT_0008446507 /DNA_START=21 /DNA_END=311 /DNA_ORIENTATION=-